MLSIFLIADWFDAFVISEIWALSQAISVSWFFSPCIWVTFSCCFTWLKILNWILDNKLCGFSFLLQSLLLRFACLFFRRLCLTIFVKSIFPTVCSLWHHFSEGKKKLTYAFTLDDSLAGFFLTVLCPDHSIEPAASIGIIPRFRLY